jgi:hypothetical protein
MNVLRSVGPDVSGLVFIFISSLLTDVAMHPPGIGGKLGADSSKN